GQDEPPLLLDHGLTCRQAHPQPAGRHLPSVELKRPVRYTLGGRCPDHRERGQATEQRDEHSCHHDSPIGAVEEATPCFQTTAPPGPNDPAQQPAHARGPGCGASGAGGDGPRTARPGVRYLIRALEGPDRRNSDSYGWTYRRRPGLILSFFA